MWVKLLCAKLLCAEVAVWLPRVQHVNKLCGLCMHTGTDVARKMVILGRECGLAIEMQQVTVESLVPPQLADAKSAEDFMHQLPQVLPTQSSDVVLVFVTLYKLALSSTGQILYQPSQPTKFMQLLETALTH